MCTPKWEARSPLITAGVHGPRSSRGLMMLCRAIWALFKKNILIIIIIITVLMYSAFLVWDTTQSALQCIITPVTGFNINPALKVHLLNSLGSILARCYFRGAHMPHHATNNVRILPGTPGWRAAMWIKCLAEGQKCQAWTGIEPGTLWSRVKDSIQYTTAPPQ